MNKVSKIEQYCKKQIKQINAVRKNSGLWTCWDGMERSYKNVLEYIKEINRKFGNDND